MFTVAAEISSFSDNDGELQVEGTLHDKGDPVMGKFDTKTKTLHRIQQRSKRKRSLELELRSKIYVYLEWREACI